MKRSLIFPLVVVLLFSSGLAASPAQAKKCSKTPAMTEGPYYLTGMPVRSNITEGLPGIKTRLTLTVLDKNCNAIPNAQVDIWHTNASGEYSGVEGNSGTYMRGSQIARENGKVTFTTVFPGWYPARTMHIHAKVWVDGVESLTTQFYTSDKVTSRVYAMAPYQSRGQQRVNNGKDGIYRSLGAKSKLLTLKAKINSKNIALDGTFVLS